MASYRLNLSCPNRAGIVASASSLLASIGSNITEAQQFDDQETGLFFMRVAFAAEEGRSRLLDEFRAIGERFDMTWRLEPAEKRKKVLILVSKFDQMCRVKRTSFVLQLNI